MYIARTKTRQQESNEVQLLLSHIKRHKSNCLSTVFRWIKEAIGLAGLKTIILNVTKVDQLHLLMQI